MTNTIDTAPGWAPFETLVARQVAGVLFVDIDAPPMNLLGPPLVRDLVALIEKAEADESVSVVVFRSANPDFFISHVDVTRIAEYRQEAAKLVGEPSIALMFRYLSASTLVSIAQIEGRARGAGSEFALGCDMRFAALETAILGQFETAFGAIPGGGAVQGLTRLMGRGRALEVLLGGQDFDAGLAERYGWINRALPASQLGGFVAELADRIARFPASGHRLAKERVNAIELADVAEFQRDSDLFAEVMSTSDAQARTQAAFSRGFQTPEAELSISEVFATDRAPGG